MFEEHCLTCKNYHQEDKYMGKCDLKPNEIIAFFDKCDKFYCKFSDKLDLRELDNLSIESKLAKLYQVFHPDKKNFSISKYKVLVNRSYGESKKLGFYRIVKILESMYHVLNDAVDLFDEVFSIVNNRLKEERYIHANFENLTDSVLKLQHYANFEDLSDQYEEEYFE